MLIDQVTITVKAGNGGNGGSTFKRNAQTPRGGPDGGNGGNGGDVYVVGINDVTALSQFQYKKEIKAEDGIAGKKNNLYGRNGADNVIQVPLGTEVIFLQDSTSIEILDTKTPILIAKGGKGGLGNNALKSATNQSPKFGEKGTAGEIKKIQLILRLIADIGLIGLPNAGKSSLLSALTNANPKIGNYPFTTLEPNLGVFEGLVLADIPGLIEGASRGKGLGFDFLRHIEKTKILAHCIDATETDVAKAYETIRQELLRYNADLSEKKEIILLTKTDLLSSQDLEKKIAQCQKLGDKVLSVSIYDEKSITLVKSAFKKLAPQK